MFDISNASKLGSSEARKLGSSEARKLGSSEARKLGSSEARKLGSSEARKLGSSEARKLGSSEARKLGSSEARKLGSSEARKLGSSEALSRLARALNNNSRFLIDFKPFSTNNYNALAAFCLAALYAPVSHGSGMAATSLDHPGEVEVTNSACERALCPAAICRKVTDGFRSMWAAKGDCAVRTFVDTGKLAGSTPFNTILTTLA